MRKGGREDVKNRGSGKGEEERVTSLFTTTCTFFILIKLKN